MKNYIKYLTIFCVSIMFTSCSDLVDDESRSDNNDKGPNLAGFTLKSKNLSAVADGNDVLALIKMEVKGPTYFEMSGDITVTVAVDPVSTAIEGVHYRLDSNTITLTSQNNYLGLYPITIITAGIVPPLAVAPTIILIVTDVSGGANVIGNGSALNMTIIYQCFADISGTYAITNDACTLFVTPTLTTITANSDGSWHIAIGDGGFLGYGCTGNPGLDNAANIVELCGEILPSRDLDFVPCCEIGVITGGSWDSVAGVLTLHQTQDFTGNWPGSWTSTYTRQ